MIFNTTDNRTKFDRLKKSTSNITIPFNAGRRTAFKPSNNSAGIKMEDWITSKMASADIALPYVYLDNVEYSTEIRTAGDDFAQIRLANGSSEGEQNFNLIAAFTSGSEGRAEIYGNSAIDNGYLHLTTNSLTGGQTSITLSNNANKPGAFNLQTLYEFADNTAALAGDLEVGDLYHTAGVVKIVV